MCSTPDLILFRANLGVISTFEYEPLNAGYFLKFFILKILIDYCGRWLHLKKTSQYSKLPSGNPQLIGLIIFLLEGPQYDLS